VTLEVGTVFGGRYMVEVLLGIGGMGAVYRAHDRRLGRKVAIKVLTGDGLSQPTAIARFTREARVGARLDHPHVVQTLDFGRVQLASGETWFLVLQLVSGGDLLGLQSRTGPLEFETACAIGFQVADALVAAHAIDLVHRDLKPENVLVESMSPLHVRLADFGMAYLTSATEPREGRLTHKGQFAGTPTYMAPEQVINENVGPAVDIYALGCVLHELVTGQPPFDGSTAALLAKHVYAPAPRLSANRASVPPALDELVERMLSKTASQRPTAEAVRRRLGTLVEATLEPHLRRELAYASDRRERMVSEPPPLESATRVSPDTAPMSLGVLGILDEAVSVALTVAGFHVAPEGQLWLAIGQSNAKITELVATGATVVATARRDDFARVSQLLRIGVSEVVLEPLIPSTVVRKLQRARSR
jgi:serine/threonine protein kinase